eukprot:TRINITY_DN2178_c0_g3_i1.p1 TRINITY_DN2178_c0_g3~~TRINITY_DN2178_c0_g3_i1.p1  ORF type:complete len:691 (+),score=149.61 TRINITY_DN2178_c0_g3_i1:135-2207(+)
MLIPAFHLSLNNTILSGLVTVGKFDGVHPSITCATSAGKLFVHSPHQKKEHEVKFLNINRAVSALSAGKLDPSKEQHVLLVGTHTNLLAYDVENNSDVFFKEVPDGANVIAVGQIGTFSSPVAIVGGNCSIQAFSHDGSEIFWTVTGDNVTSLALCDVDGDSESELLVGSEDYEIRFFKGEEVLSELTETDRVTALCNIQSPKYGYALANGTVGVYNKGNRVWRTKTKNTVMSIESYDLDNDGVPEIITGWSSGRMDVRSIKDGNVIFKDTFASPIAAFVKADYRMSGKKQLVCCSTDGDIRGYLPVEAEKAGNLMDVNVHEEALAVLTQKKQELMFELQTYEDNIKKLKVGNLDAGTVSVDTKVSCRLETNLNDFCMDLVLQSSTDAQIRCVIIFADQIFEEESLVVHPSNPSPELRIPIKPLKNAGANMLVKALVGHKSSSQCQVFEVTQTLPKFTTYLPCPLKGKEPESYVSFAISERVNRVIMWMNQVFLIDHPMNNTLDVTFISLHDNKPLRLTLQNNEMTIKTDDFEAAGDIIQDLATYLGVQELESTAHFPTDMEAFRHLLTQVDEFNATRLRLTAEMADNSNLIKNLVVRSEDSRLLGDIKTMKRYYSSLFDINRGLILEYKKRESNHTGLLEALKKVNQFIQQAARLRVGNAKTRIISACRTAIKANNVQSLFKIIKSGKV